MEREVGEGDSGGPSIRNTLRDFQNEMRVPNVGEIVQKFLPFMILFMTYKNFFIHIDSLHSNTSNIKEI